METFSRNIIVKILKCLSIHTIICILEANFIKFGLLHKTRLKTFLNFFQLWLHCYCLLWTKLTAPFIFKLSNVHYVKESLSMYTITFSLAVLANNFIVLRIRKDTQMMKDSPWACTYLILHQYRMILSRTMTISCTIYIVPVTSFLVSSLISWDSTKRK